MMSFLFRGNNELQFLLQNSRMNEKRETLFKDRTHCHADHISQGQMEQITTAAVGVLKAVTMADDRWECVYVSIKW